MRFFSINDTAHKIAGGAACGIFCGVFPGLGIVMALILASLFKFNKVATLSGVLLTNTWISLLVLPLATTMTAWLSGSSNKALLREVADLYQAQNWSGLLQWSLSDFAWYLILSLVVISLVLALVSYFIIRSLLLFSDKHTSKD